MKPATEHDITITKTVDGKYSLSSFKLIEESEEDGVPCADYAVVMRDFDSREEVLAAVTELLF